jgi:hypothetical protein
MPSQIIMPKPKKIERIMIPNKSLSICLEHSQNNPQKIKIKIKIKINKNK